MAPPPLPPDYASGAAVTGGWSKPVGPSTAAASTTTTTTTTTAAAAAAAADDDWGNAGWGLPPVSSNKGTQDWTSQDYNQAGSGGDGGGGHVSSNANTNQVTVERKKSWIYSSRHRQKQHDSSHCHQIVNSRVLFFAFLTLVSCFCACRPTKMR